MLGSVQQLAYSKQIYHLNLDGGLCQLLSAHPELRESIDYYWLLSIESPEVLLEVIPDTAMDLVLSPEIKKFAALYFPSTKKFSIPLEGPIQYTGICFRSASTSELLGSEMNDLRKLNVGTDIIEHLNIRPLVDAIQGVKEFSTLKTVFDQFWLDRLATTEKTLKFEASLSQSELITLLERSLGTDSIASVCQSLQVSERQFRRLSHELFGLSPKKIQRVLRLQTGLAELFACEKQQLEDLYYDDSHRIRELKSLTGFTPDQIRRMAEKYNKD